MSVPQMERSKLFARHLEVFVPKPTTYASEDRLRNVLDVILSKEIIPKNPLETGLAKLCSDRVRKLLARRGYWENILYGYSTYVVDGTFMGGRVGRRHLADGCREVTVVLKFVVTNYTTEVDNEDLSLLNRSRDWSLAGTDRRTELIATRQHYRDTCEFVVNMVEEYVLRDELEVWSQEWDTILDRRASSVAKIVRTGRDRTRRFEVHERNSVVCVCDYCASNGSTSWKPGLKKGHRRN